MKLIIAVVIALILIGCAPYTPPSEKPTSSKEKSRPVISTSTYLKCEEETIKQYSYLSQIEKQRLLYLITLVREPHNITINLDEYATKNVLKGYNYYRKCLGIVVRVNSTV